MVKGRKDMARLQNGIEKGGENGAKRIVNKREVFVCEVVGSSSFVMR